MSGIFRYFPFSPNKCTILTLKQTKISGSTKHSKVPATTQGTAGTFGKKVYCSFWCRTGCCDYTQQGCKFLHEIPQDPEIRESMGLRDFPTWMQEEPRGPRPAKASSVDRMQEGNWRRERTQDYQRVLPAGPTPGHDRALSHRVTSVPYSGRVQTSRFTQTPTMTPTNTGGQASGPRIPKLHKPSNLTQTPTIMPTNTGGQASGTRIPNLHKPQAAQQAALLIPVQQYCPSSTGSAINTRPQMQLNTFDGADGNMNFQSISSGGKEIFRYQYPTNDTFSNAKVVGTNERRPVPATQPPISRPVLSAQALSTSSMGKDTTNPTIYTPNQNIANTVPQARASADSNTTTSAHAMKANQKAFSSNGSGRSTSRARTLASSGTNNAAAGDGADQTLSSLVDGSTPSSPPVMHRRLFVSPGGPKYMANPIGTGSSKPRPHSRSKRGANAKGRGYGAGKASQWGKARGQGGQEEDLVPLLGEE